MRKNQLLPFRLKLDQSLTYDFETDPILVSTIDNVGYWAVTDGVSANTGVFTVQVRAYRDENNYGPWVDLTLDSAPTLANSDDSFFINLNQLPPCQARLIFTAAPAGSVDAKTITFPTKASSADGDYIRLVDPLGTYWAVAIDKTGGAANEPTGANWVAIPAARKIYADFSAGTTAASMAAIAETALNSLEGFTAAMTTDDSAADGTMLVTQILYGVNGAFVPKNKGDTGAGTISVANGAAGTGPDGTVEIWVSGTEI